MLVLYSNSAQVIKVVHFRGDFHSCTVVLANCYKILAQHLDLNSITD